MADTKISVLAAVAAVLAAQEFAVNDAGTSKKATATQIKTWANGLEFLGRTQLGAAAENITVSFTARVGLFFLVAHIAGYSAASIARWRVNNDSGANYSTVAAEPANAAATATVNANGIILGETAQTVPRSPVHTIMHKPSATQIAFFSGLHGDGSEAKATALDAIYVAGLWDNVLDSVSSIVLNSGTAGTNLLAGSYVEIYGIKNAASA